MSCVVSGKIAAAGSQTAFASTHNRMCTRQSLSLSLPFSTAAPGGPNTPPPLSCFLVWVRGYCPFLNFGAHHTPLHPIFKFWPREHYNLFSTCKYVLSLNLYFKPNEAILKRHIFLFKPQLRHLVLGPQVVGGVEVSKYQSIGSAWRFSVLTIYRGMRRKSKTG